MRQRIVWFLLGVLVGSLFVVAAYPNESNAIHVQYGVPVVEKIQGDGYTSYIFYTKDGLPIDTRFLIGTIPKLVERASPRAAYHVYALPNLPKRLIVIGYGVKISDNGETSTLIVATRWNARVPPYELHAKLVKWGKEAPKEQLFRRNTNRTLGSQEKWMIKTIDNTGKTRTFGASAENSPYWYEFADPITMEITDPPYGNIYFKFYLYGLRSDGNPHREYLLIAPDKSGDGGYETDPGYGLRTIEGNTNYGNYVTESAKIIHNWNLESTLDPQLDEADPVESLGGHSTIQVTVGYPPAVTFTVAIPDSEMLPAIDRSTETATWLLKFNTDSNDAKYSFKTNVASEASVSEEALHDGQWHAIVNVKMQATFKECCNWLEWWEDHTTECSVTLYMKVG